MHFINKGEIMKAKNGSNVSVHYRGTLTDGTEFDNSRVRGETLDFQVGVTNMISGFTKAVIGMTEGQKKTITLSPDEAYGNRNPEAFQAFPKQAFGENFSQLAVGETVQGQGAEGAFLAKVHEMSEDSVVLDLNHPLAGQELNFEIEVLSVQESA